MLRDVQLSDGLSGVTIAPCVLIQLHAELLCGIVIHLISYLMVRFSIRHAFILFVENCDFCRVSGETSGFDLYAHFSGRGPLQVGVVEREHLLLSDIPG